MQRQATHQGGQGPGSFPPTHLVNLSGELLLKGLWRWEVKNEASTYRAMLGIMLLNITPWMLPTMPALLRQAPYPCMRS